MAVSKVVYGGNTLIDLTSDTITAEKLLKGYTAHGADGEALAGACEYDANTSDATATDSELLAGKIAYVRGNKVTGTMPNNGAISGIISEKDGAVVIQQGYHDGAGTVQIDAAERAKIIAGNIRAGVVILGVTGEMSGEEGVNAQSRTVTPSTTQQTILPEEGYNYLTQVVVSAIPYTESENSAGGTTVTIA